MTAPVKLNAFEEALLADLPIEAADWRADLRADLGARGLPHRRIEEWKWSDLRSVLSRLAPGPGDLAFTPSRAPDGRGPVDHAPAMIMPRLAAALGGDCEVFEIAGEAGQPLSLDFNARSGAGHKIIAIQIAPGARVQIRERYTAAKGAFANLAMLITLGEGAQVERVIEQPPSPGGVLVVTGGVSVAPGAAFTQTTLALGAQLARLETHVHNDGHGAAVALNGAYLVAGGLHLDQTTTVSHEAEGGTTAELFKGAAASKGRGVFQGKIHVARPAQKTDARMNHRGLLLEPGAEIDAKPELEIYADDVACAHGNAIGAIDPAALFYLRQRGLPEARARALLTESFLAEPLEAIGDEALRDGMLARLRARLEEAA